MPHGKQIPLFLLTPGPTKNRQLEPPYWYYQVRQSLGAALLRSGDAEGAREVFEDSLERSPNNGWALFGLMQAQKALGDDTSAAETQKRFAAAWLGGPESLNLS